MNEQDILVQMADIGKNLDKITNFIIDNNWDGVEGQLAKNAAIQEQIKKAGPDVETMMEQNPTFKMEYEFLKNTLMMKSQQVVESIEHWKSTHTEKISQSKAVLDNISKYNRQSKTSYYFDRKE